MLFWQFTYYGLLGNNKNDLYNILYFDPLQNIKFDPVRYI